MFYYGALPTIQEAMDIGRQIARDKFNLQQQDIFRRAQAERLFAEANRLIPAQAQSYLSEALYGIPARAYASVLGAELEPLTRAYSTGSQFYSNYIHPEAWSHFYQNISPFINSLLQRKALPSGNTLDLTNLFGGY